MENSQKPYLALVILILIVGSFLRFWNYFSIPFMFDELSAMGRTTYDTFLDVIRFGVVEKDSHPAGVQVFLYYWVQLFGDSEPVVKLPFLIAGIASIWVSYKIGELWFGKPTAILTAAFVSSLQLFVMYSQIARPYISGLFITLVMVWYWSKYFFLKPKIKYLIWFAIFGALAAYNHYFSLLFAATVGLTGLLLVNRKTIIPYCLSGVAILVLYVPHLGILFEQAEKGTIGGWLGEPGPYFVLNFLYWLFHKSVFSIVLFLLLLIAGISATKSKTGSPSYQNKKRMLLFIWLLPALIFGYIYSYSVEPILQNSLLIFTTPYLFILLFSFVGDISWKKLGVAVFLILIVNSLTLIFVRDYYRVFYKQPFQNMAESAKELENQYPEEVFILNDYIPYFTDYYLGKDANTRIPYYTTRNAGFNILQFDSVVSKIEQKYVLTSGLDDQYFQIVKSHFPYWVGYDFGFTFEQYIFSKIKPDEKDILKRQQLGFTDFDRITCAWSISQDNIKFDTITNSNLFHFSPDNLWGPKITINMDSLDFSTYEIIDVMIEVYPEETFCNPILVGEIKKGDIQLSWLGFNFGDFEFAEGRWQRFYATIDIQKALNDKEKVDNCTLDLYLWNPNKNRFLLKEISIVRRPGNPDRYGL